MAAKFNFSKHYFLLVLCACFSMAAQNPDLLELMSESQERLTVLSSANLAQQKLKKLDLQLTRDGFFRLRRTYLNGKQEYFSFSFSEFEEMNYLGTTQSGTLILKAQPESIIVQTFRDSRGNIDTMATTLKLPLQQLEAADLNMLQDCFQRIKERLKR